MHFTELLQLLITFYSLILYLLFFLLISNKSFHKKLIKALQGERSTCDGEVSNMDDLAQTPKSSKSGN